MSLLTKSRRREKKNLKKNYCVCFPIDMHMCINKTSRTSASEQRTLNTRRALLRLQLKKCTTSRFVQTCCLAKYSNKLYSGHCYAVFCRKFLPPIRNKVALANACTRGIVTVKNISKVSLSNNISLVKSRFNFNKPYNFNCTH